MVVSAILRGENYDEKLRASFIWRRYFKRFESAQQHNCRFFEAG